MCPGGPFFFFQAEDGIRDTSVTGVQTCALPISAPDGKSARATPKTLPINARPAFVIVVPPPCWCRLLGSPCPGPLHRPAPHGLSRGNGERGGTASATGLRGDAVQAALLGAVERALGGLQDVVGIGTGSLGLGDANADRHRDRPLDGADARGPARASRLRNRHVQGRRLDGSPDD